MNNFVHFKKEILNDGFAIIENVYHRAEIDSIISVINDADHTNINFRKTDDVFAIRQFFKELPQVKELVFIDRLKLI